MEVQEWLGHNNQLGIDIWNKKYRFENETLDQFFDRVSSGKEKVKQLIIDKKFLFGGRTLSNRGTGKKASYSNCYSSGYAPDSVLEMMDLNKDLALTYKSQGGQGLSLSKIRPKGTDINGGQFKSDGIVPFMEMFNQTTASISQGGSRKGALMISLSCKHKEIETFINIKSASDKITKANLSVEIDDEFMNAIEEYYKTGKIVELNIKENYEGNIAEYSIVPIDVYKNMMNRAYDWAEPGVIMTNRFRNYNLMELDDEYMVITGNPCGEQPLPKNGACNLGSFNLSIYVLNPFTSKAEFDYDTFSNDVEIGIEALDDVLEEGKYLHALEGQKEMAINYRNIGLGIMSMGDTFFKLGIKYGSQESKNILDKIMEIMFVSAVKASSKLAELKGSFPKYTDKVFDSEIIRNHFSEEERNELKKHGLRNCSLLSIAPSGSIGTMLNVTTGIEPAFQISYTRKTESLHKDKDMTYEVYIGSADEFTKLYNTDVLPDYFVTSSNIHWKDRIDIQSIAQNHVDTAISSTVNLPENIRIGEVEQLYLYAWQKGLKGVTIYRDNCKRSGILTNTPSTTTIESKEAEFVPDSIFPISRSSLGKTYGVTVDKKTACGKMFITINRDKSGNIVESFVNVGKQGVCKSNVDGLNRLISLALRSGIRVEEISDQLKGISCASCSRAKSKGEKIDGISCPDIIGRLLEEEYKDNVIIKEVKPRVKKPKEIVKVEEINIFGCPECGKQLSSTGGCYVCPNCSYSKCE